jgi:hypothetical protein
MIRVEMSRMYSRKQTVESPCCVDSKLKRLVSGSQLALSRGNILSNLLRNGQVFEWYAQTFTVDCLLGCGRLPLEDSPLRV